MQEALRQTRSHLMALFDEKGFRPRGDFGQNFLIDLNIIESIVRAADLQRSDVVLEVGTGTGGMTSFLAQEAGHVVSVEIDRNMYGIAREVVAPYDNVTLLNCDALKNKNRFAAEVIEAIETQLAAGPDRDLKLVANLPYSVATPVVSNLVATELPWVLIVVTIQYELGLRMLARPGKSNYGSLSVWLQSQCDVEMIRKLGPTVFWPRPQVDSAVMRVTPVIERRERIRDRRFFQDFLRRVFQLRRKLLRGVLAGMYRKQMTKTAIDDVFAELGLSATCRAEELDIPVLVELSNRLQEIVESGD